VKFLVDNAVSPAVSAALGRAGHDSVHVRQLGLHDAADEVVLDTAIREARILVSADTDFGALLVFRAAAAPSVVLFRHGAEHHPERQAALLLSNLDRLAEHLHAGALITIEPTRIRVRQLPLGP
jgi:predicted nuclease of predicted toxin-antitoxin system